MPPSSGRKAGKSRRKTSGSGRVTRIVTGNRVKGGITIERRWSRGLGAADLDEFGLETRGKYAGLGRRCRENVALAIGEGFDYNTTYGTTEEQVCYGELRRRGFVVGLGLGPRSFIPQSPIAGSIVDFEVWILGERRALRPMNEYWHGAEAQRNHDDDRGEQIVAAGYILNDIWSGHSLDDQMLEFKFDQFYGSP